MSKMILQQDSSVFQIALDQAQCVNGLIRPIKTEMIRDKARSKATNWTARTSKSIIWF